MGSGGQKKTVLVTVSLIGLVMIVVVITGILILFDRDQNMGNAKAENPSVVEEYDGRVGVGAEPGIADGESDKFSAPGDIDSKSSPGTENSTPAGPSEAVVGQVTGRWSLDMQSSFFQLEEIPVLMNADGTMSYESTAGMPFYIKDGEYTWNRQSGALLASCSSEIDTGYGYTFQVKLEFDGRTDPSVNTAQGTFTATPEGDYSMFADEGTFRLSR